MGFLISPGVDINEIDLTHVIPAVATTSAGIVGNFRWGPAEKVISVGTDTELASEFGNPVEQITIGGTKTATTAFTENFLIASSFLRYGNNLKVYRKVDTDAGGTHNGGHANAFDVDSPNLALSNTTARSVDVLIKNTEDFERQDGTFTKSTHHQKGGGLFIARYPGSLGNSLKVHVIGRDANSPELTSGAGFVEFSNLFPVLLDQSPTNTGGTNPQEIDSSNSRHKSLFHIAVEDEDGAITGTAGSILESFSNVSLREEDKDESGNSIFYRDVLERQSNWIWPGAKDFGGRSAQVAATGNINSPSNTSNSPSAQVDNSFSTRLKFGADSITGGASEASRVSAYDTAFGDKDTIDIDILLGGGVTPANANTVIAVADKRKDCVAFVSPETRITANRTSTSEQLNGVKSWNKQVNSSSYAMTESTAVKVYDKFNDKFRFIPACGHTAGLCVNTEQVADAWFSPAGFNRGGLRAVTKLAYNPTQAQRDELYSNGINPIVSFPGQGTVLFGDKTMQKKPSAFDRINVRRLFITLEKAIATAAKFQLFEINDEFTRAQFRNLVEPFLRDVKGRRGITDFLVVCDETNNTSAVVDGNRFVADIFVKPTRSINFISLNFIATRSGVEFEEIVGTGN